MIADLINKDRDWKFELAPPSTVTSYCFFLSCCGKLFQFAMRPFSQTTLKRKCVTTASSLLALELRHLLVGAGPPGDWKGREDGAAVEETEGGGGDEEGGPEDLCARLWEGR